MRLPTTALAFALAACHAASPAAPRARLAQPSGLERVSLLAKGME